MSVILDVLFLFVVISIVYNTYRRGFVKSVLGFAASILSIVLSNALSPYVSEVYLPFLTEKLSGADKQISEITLSLLSHALAFVTVFTVISVLLRIVITFISGVFKLPVLSGLNKALGLVLGCAEALIFVFLFTAVLQLSVPFIKDAQPGLCIDEIIQATYIFKHIYNIEWMNLLVN